MKEIVPNYFKKFKCIASKCEDTCCAGWEVTIDEKTYEKYKSVKGSFGERLKSNIVFDGCDNIFKLKNNNCSFLNDKKMCDIYIELGEDSLCYICSQFPRIMEQFEDIKEVGLSFACPEVARVILNSDEKIELEVNKIIEDLNEDEVDINKEHFKLLMKCREISLNIIQNRKIDFNKRVGIVLKLVEEVQDRIDWDEMHEIEDVLKDYSNEGVLNEILDEFGKYEAKNQIKYDTMEQWLNIYMNLTHINDNDPLNLNKALEYFYKKDKNINFYIDSHKEFEKFYEKNIYKFEQILVYFVLRYFMKSIFDYDLSAKIKIAIVSCLIIKELCIVKWLENNKSFSDADIVKIVQTYSKDIEHLEENIEYLMDIFENSYLFSEDMLVDMLLN